MSALPHVPEYPMVSESRHLRLRCPRCQSSLSDLTVGIPLFETAIPCTCGFVLTHDRGIWLALPPERAKKYERFLTEYQIVRAAEGRGSGEADFYLSLPYRDLSGRNQSQWTIRAKTYRYLEQHILPAISRSGSTLDILDLGAGNGWLSYRLALLGHSPIAVDLLTNSADGLGAATHFLERLKCLFPRFQAELDCLPFANDQFDCAIFNASFHYSEDFRRTLGEALRCLRPGGAVVITDSPWYRKEESGQQMLRERRSAFQQRFGFPSDGLASLEYLTDRRLEDLEQAFNIEWRTHAPGYGLAWALRPLIAKVKGKREPSTFRVYVAEVHGA